EELEWCLERGAKVILVRPARVPGYRGSRSPAYPEFEPFWKLVEETGTLVAMHASDSGYSRYQGDWTGPSEMLPFRLDAFRMMAGKDRPIVDTMTALACHGLFTRFPNLKIAAVENGGDWVPGFLQHLGDTHKKMPQMFDEAPVEAFKRNVWVNPFHEDDIEKLVDLLGVDHILFGSDWPHPEGLAEPCSYVDHLPKSLPHEDVAKIM